MNYLAHLYLSGNDEGMITGNLIADHVKGKAYNNYPDPVKRGILLHRKIDHFTDSHPVVHQSKARFNGKYGRYSGVLTDMFYDHFLSAGWNDYSEEPIDSYTARIYSMLLSKPELLPEPTLQMLRFMAEHNWLKAYGTLTGLFRALDGMTRRWSLPFDLSLSVTDLKNNYAEFKQDFELFFPALVIYCDEMRHEMNASPERG